jgi:hypothetical protein
MVEISPVRPVQAGGTEFTRFNALRHGILSRYTVLPWEDAKEYGTLLAALVAEHSPQGPTEEHLVEELAGVLWRKRRLRLAESASYRRGLEEALDRYENGADAVRASTADNAIEIAEIVADEARTLQARDLLYSHDKDRYDAALAELLEGTREWWADTLSGDADDIKEGDAPATADAAGLRHFLEEKVLPWFETRKKEVANRAVIREHAISESLNPDRLERLGRYEVHLDRKLERAHLC